MTYKEIGRIKGKKIEGFSLTRISLEPIDSRSKVNIIVRHPRSINHVALKPYLTIDSMEDEFLMILKECRLPPQMHSPYSFISFVKRTV